jgi:hypothetical protein
VLHPAPGCDLRCDTPEKDAISDLSRRNIYCPHLLLRSDTDLDYHRRADDRMLRRSAHNKNHNVLAIRGYLHTVPDTKNTNFLFLLQFIRQFFVPLRPRNFAHWSIDCFSGYFLGSPSPKKSSFSGPKHKI